MSFFHPDKNLCKRTVSRYTHMDAVSTLDVRILFEAIKFSCSAR